MTLPDPADYSGVRVGPLTAGEWVSLTDQKGHRKSLLLETGKVFHTTKGGLAHDEIIGMRREPSLRRILTCLSGSSSMICP